MTTSTTSTPTERTKARIIEGVVVSDKMDKTRVIEIRRTVQHGLYHKRQVKKSRLFIHDEKNVSKLGDRIQAVSSRPLSKNKAFRLVKVVEKKVVV
jgi:small subunit ribosomal protein S17